MMNEELKNRFSAIVGVVHALESAEDKAPFLREWRDKYQGAAGLVLLPASTLEVAAIVRLANETGTALVPQGGNTGVVGGQVPDLTGEQVVVSLRRLDKLRSLSPEGYSMVVGAGMTLAEAQTRAEMKNRLLPLSLASEGSAQIGGVIATNAGGVGVLKYGMMRDLVLGLEVVLASGEIWHGLSSLRKDNTGYDIKALFAGSEGTLGIITAASLKLFALPVERRAAFVGLNGLEDLPRFFEHCQSDAGPGLGAFEIISERGLEFSLDFLRAQRGSCTPPLKGRYPWYALIELESCQMGGASALMAPLLETALEKGLIADGVVSSSEQQRLALWEVREVLSEAQKPAGGSIKHDVSVPLAAVAAFIKEADSVVEGMLPGARPVPFGHFGDGNVHYNVSQPEGMDKSEFLSHWEALSEAVYEVVLKHQGSISAEHGIGVMKRDLLARVTDPAEMGMMRAIKKALDPTGIMNPGKVL